MPSSYPSSSDTFTVPSGSATLGGSMPTHTDAHQQMADAIRKVQDTIVLSGLSVGALLYGASGTQVTTLAAGAAGRFLQANGAAAPAWFDLFGAANAWTGANSFTTASGTQTIRQTDASNANAALSIRNDRNSGSYSLELLVPGSSFGGYGLVVAESAVLYSQRPIRLVSDSASGEIVLGVGATGGSRVLTCVNGAAYFGTDPGGSEFLRVGGSLRISDGSIWQGGYKLRMSDATNLNCDVNSTYLSQNSTDASTGNYLKTGYAGQLWLNSSSGDHYLRAAASGTAGNPITWLDRVTWNGTGIGFYGVAPVARATAAAAATDAATTQTLANSLRTILINLGLAQ